MDGEEIFSRKKQIIQEKNYVNKYYIETEFIDKRAFTKKRLQRGMKRDT